MSKILKALAVTAGAATTLLINATSASAANVNPIPPGWYVADGGANAQGVGFCLSQVAQNPEEIDGVPNFGAAVTSIAADGPGAVATKIDEARYPLCGGPGA